MDRRYRIRDLLEGAALQKTIASKPLVRDWIGLGLLDRPDRGPGLGQGQGSAPGTWSHSQYRMFLALLGLQRRCGIERVATLCNPVVWTWIHYDEKVHVPIRQAKRALDTWVSRYQTSSRRRARVTARELVKQFIHEKARPRDRAAFIEIVAECALTGRWDSELVHAAAIPVCDPLRDRVGTMRLAAADDAVRVIAARYRGMRIVSKLTDDELRRLRGIYLGVRRQFVFSKPLVTWDIRRADWSYPKELDWEVQNVIVNFLGIVGVHGIEALAAESAG